MQPEMREYRQGLVDSLRFMNESYDKLLIALSGGALALSITFLKDVIELEATSGRVLLLLAWASFVVSLSAVLGRLLFGINAYRKAIRQVDDESINAVNVGGAYTKITKFLHPISAFFLVWGLVPLVWFAFINVGAANE